MDSSKYICRVSSVLNRDVKQYGKKYMFDEKEDTCWSSDQGSPQWVEVNFNEEQVISSLLIQFQGGFVGQDCHVEITKPNENEVTVLPFYPEDVNTPQEFPLEPTKVKVVRVIFKKSTDFFGRIVIYNLCFRFA